MQRQYWAHSSRLQEANANSRAGWQLLSDHLTTAARISRNLAALARPGDDRFQSLAGVAGLFHDVGKYTDRFQRMLDGGPGCQHAIHGAMLAHFGSGSEQKPPPMLPLVAAIAGHHAGLPDLSGSARSLQDRLREEQFRREMREILNRAEADCPSLGVALRSGTFAIPPAGSDESSEFDLVTRMVFSCLVDADRLDSAGRSPQHNPLDAEEGLRAILRHVERLADQSPAGLVKDMRRKVLEDCLAAAGRPGGLFSLSVPTGGGKTLASLAFAMRRASLQAGRFRRIIVVIPYLSVIEQNAEVYRDVLGAETILEHHSGSVSRLRQTETKSKLPQEETAKYVPADESDEDGPYQRTGQRIETENWDSPIIVTTSVRFFESLFSNRPRDLRRIHNVARSIVILDEVQTLPRRLLAPLLGMIRELTDNWGVNFVFATATQPAFESAGTQGDVRWESGTISEIIHEPDVLRSGLLRTKIRWEIDQPADWSAIAERGLGSRQCLAVVNLRRHALELYRCFQELGSAKGIGPDAIFHLSTRMSAAHRLRVLDRIRARLREGLQCHVCSTQLVEAGVDLDFPLVLRALSPLDSVIQAAGRADREGTRTLELGRPGGEVVVFEPFDSRMPSADYAEATAVTRTLVQREREQGREIQADSVGAIREYFERYYGDADLGKELAEMRAGVTGKFATLADRFEMISSRTLDVFVPDDAEARQAISDLRTAHHLTSDLRQRLRRHSVGLYPSEFSMARGMIEELTPGSNIWIAAEAAYTEELGLLNEIPPEATVL